LEELIKKNTEPFYLCHDDDGKKENHPQSYLEVKQVVMTNKPGKNSPIKRGIDMSEMEEEVEIERV
jgi:hypothetical protein